MGVVRDNCGPDASIGGDHRATVRDGTGFGRLEPVCVRVANGGYETGQPTGTTVIRLVREA
jgi:hypothetical protein